MTADDLAMEVIAAQADDLFEKIRRDIAEGGYHPGVTLSALLRVTVVQLLSSGIATEAAEAFCYYATDLVREFDIGLRKLPPSADED